VFAEIMFSRETAISPTCATNPAGGRGAIGDDRIRLQVMHRHGNFGVPQHRGEKPRSVSDFEDFSRAKKKKTGSPAFSFGSRHSGTLLPNYK